jgi:hypothetical protein
MGGLIVAKFITAEAAKREALAQIEAKLATEEAELATKEAERAAREKKRTHFRESNRWKVRLRW